MLTFKAQQENISTLTQLQENVQSVDDLYKDLYKPDEQHENKKRQVTDLI